MTVPRSKMYLPHTYRILPSEMGVNRKNVEGRCLVLDFNAGGQR